MLRLLVVEADDRPAIGTAVLVHALDPVVARARHLEVDGVYAVRDVEAVILLVPMAWAALNDLDAGPRLGWLPPCTHRLALAALFAVILRPSCLTINFGLPLACLDRLRR